jgi:predicted HicB family RNase H-like nuclease
VALKTKTKKTKIVTTNLRLPVPLHRALVKAAKEDRRTMNTCILIAIEEWLERQEA